MLSRKLRIPVCWNTAYIQSLGLFCAVRQYVHSQGYTLLTRLLLISWRKFLRLLNPLLEFLSKRFAYTRNWNRNSWKNYMYDPVFWTNLDLWIHIRVVFLRSLTCLGVQCVMINSNDSWMTFSLWKNVDQIVKHQSR